MSESPEPTVEREDVEIIIIGAPKAIKSMVNDFHLSRVVRFEKWSEFKHSKDHEQVIMAATKTLYI